MPTIPGFFGREAELTWLLRLWDDTAIRNEKGARVGPRMAILIAETGLGKSRLVQQLYDVLANDPVWNPPDKKYWPDTIVSDTRQIHENPSLVDHVPNGPPRFLWLGARWQPIDTRNVEERTCIIPALRDALYAHVLIAQRHRTSWQRLRTSAEKKIKTEGPDYLVDKALDLSGIPYAGLVLKVIKAGVAARNAPTTVSRVFQKQQEDAADVLLAEMREVFGGLGSGGLVLPTILWLDDAHWIDPLTLRFLHTLWKEASENRWPLMIIITHWEQEWNKLQSERAATGSLLDLATQPGAEKWILSKAPVEDIAARLSQKLPGLLSTQSTWMLEKAAGNFLTLEENIGELISTPENFVDQRIDGPLTEAGEDLVATWASDRERRIQERFNAMKPKPTLQQLLAWASRVGIRFPQDVPADFATQRQSGPPLDHHKLLDSCRDPYAVLGAPSSNLLEFRDRAYHSAAVDYFQKYRAKTDESGLLASLRDTLAGWINGTFEAYGDVQQTGDNATATLGSDTDRFSSFGSEEKRAVLEIALRELPLPTNADWTDAHHRAALRSILLYLDLAGQNSLWPAVSQCAPRLIGMRWEGVPSVVVSTEFLSRIGDWLHEAAMTKEAVPLLEEVLARRQQASLRDPDWAIKMTRTLDLLSLIHVTTGSYDAAEELMLRSLQIAEQTFGAEALQLIHPLVTRGRVLINIGRYREAEADLLRAQRICDQVWAPDNIDLAMLGGLLGEVYLKTGRAPQAEVNLRKTTEMLENRSDPHSFATALTLLGEALSAQSRPEEAEPLHRRALAILELTFGQENPNLSLALNSLAADLHDLGRTEDAIPLMMRDIKIVEKAYGTAHIGMATALSNLAEMYWSQGDETKATPLAHRALAITEELVGPYHPMVATILSNQGDHLRIYGQLKASEPLFHRAIAIMERSPDPKSQPLGQAYNCLGLLRQAEGRNAEAEACFERAITFMVPSLTPDFGPDYAKVTHQPLGPAFNSLGLFFQSKGELDVAEICFEQAMIFMEHDLGPGHPGVAQLFDNRAILYRAIGNNDKEKAALARAQEIRQAVKDSSKAPLSTLVAG